MAECARTLVSPIIIIVLWPVDILIIREIGSNTGRLAVN